MKTKIILILSLFVLLFAGRYIFLSTSSPLLSCEEKEHDFGLLPVHDGKAIGRHVFKIKNNTKQPLRIVASSSCSCMVVESYTKEIAPNAISEVAVKLTLDEQDFANRGAFLRIESEEENLLLLKIAVKGRAGLSSYLTTTTTQLGDFYQNNFQGRETSFSVFTHYDLRRGIPELKVRIEDPTLFSIKISETNIPIEKIEQEEGILARKIKLYPSTEIVSKLGENETLVFVETSDGLRREFPLKWNVVTKEIFDSGKRYYLTGLRIGEKRRFKVRYDNFTGGELEKYTLSTDKISVQKIEREGTNSVIELELLFDELPENPKKYHELNVTTKNGKRHTLEIYLSTEV